MKDDEFSDLDLGAIRWSLREHFDSERRAAPPVPRRLHSIAAANSPRRTRRFGVGLATGCLAAASLIVALSLRQRADASPAAALGRAAANYLSLDDATLRIEIESVALAFMTALSESENADTRSNFETMVFFVDVARPDRFVIRRENESKPGIALAGCDGSKLWSFDAGAGRAQVLDLGDDVDPPEFDLTRWLSFEFVSQIEKEAGRGRLVEVARSDQENGAGGLRRFRVEPREGVGSTSPFHWSGATLTVDAPTDTIVDARITLQVGPLRFAEARVEIVARNSGFDPRHFSVEANVPESTRIVELAIHEPTFAAESSQDVDEAVADEPFAIVLARTGMRFSELESVLRRNLISTSTAYGLKVVSVAPESPAARAGILPGDILMKWNAQPVRSTRELSDWLDDRAAPASVPVEVARRKRVSLLSRKPWIDVSLTLTPEPRR